MSDVLILLAPGCEEIEAVTAIDLLRRAKIKVTVASLAAGPVKASRGTVLVADTTLEQVMSQKFEMIVLPGGQPGTNNLNADPRVHKLLQRMHDEGRYIAAICAAPKILATAGLLRNKRATCFPGTLDPYIGDMNISVVNLPVVQDQNIITSQGPGTAMDFSLELIEILEGSTSRHEVENALQRPTI